MSNACVSFAGPSVKLEITLVFLFFIIASMPFFGFKARIKTAPALYPSPLATTLTQ